MEVFLVFACKFALPEMYLEMRPPQWWLTTIICMDVESTSTNCSTDSLELRSLKWHTTPPKWIVMSAQPTWRQDGQIGQPWRSSTGRLLTFLFRLMRDKLLALRWNNWLQKIQCCRKRSLLRRIPQSYSQYTIQYSKFSVGNLVIST